MPKEFSRFLSARHFHIPERRTMKINDKDAAKACYWQSNERIADFLNVNIFRGARRISPEEVRDMPAMASALIPFENIREDAYDFITFMTNSTELAKIKENLQVEGGYNMCKALRDMRIEAMKEGKRIGEKRGINLGIAAMIQDNRDLGISAEAIADKLQRYFTLSREDALKQISDCP